MSCITLLKSGLKRIYKMIIPNFQKLPDHILIQYGNSLDNLLSKLVSIGKDNTITYKLGFIIQKQIDYELDNRFKMV